jgi:hypothetical protein
MNNNSLGNKNKNNNPTQAVSSNINETDEASDPEALSDVDTTQIIGNLEVSTGDLFMSLSADYDDSETNEVKKKNNNSNENKGMVALMKNIPENENFSNISIEDNEDLNTTNKGFKWIKKESDKKINENIRQKKKREIKEREVKMTIKEERKTKKNLEIKDNKKNESDSNIVDDVSEVISGKKNKQEIMEDRALIRNMASIKSNFKLINNIVKQKNEIITVKLSNQEQELEKSLDIKVDKGDEKTFNYLLESISGDVKFTLESHLTKTMREEFKIDLNKLIPTIETITNLHYDFSVGKGI